MKGFLNEESALALIKQVISEKAKNYEKSFQNEESYFFGIGSVLFAIISHSEVIDFDEEFQTSCESSLGSENGLIVYEELKSAFSKVNESDKKELHNQLVEIPIPYLELALGKYFYSGDMDRYVSVLSQFFSEGKKNIKKIDFDFYNPAFFEFSLNTNNELFGITYDAPCVLVDSIICSFFLKNRVQLIQMEEYELNDGYVKYDLAYMNPKNIPSPYGLPEEYDTGNEFANSSLSAAFMLMNNISEDGKGILVLQKATAFNSENEELRKKLIENHWIEAVIEGNTKVSFSNTQEVIYILSRNNQKIKLINLLKGRGEDYEIITPKELVKILRSDDIEDYNKKNVVEIAYEEYERINTNYSLLSTTYLYRPEYGCNTCLLSDLAEIKRGSVKPVPTLKQKVIVVKKGESSRVISQMDLDEVFIEPKNLSHTNYDKGLLKYSLKKGDSIVISRAGLTKFKVAFVHLDNDEYIIVGSNLFYLEPKEDVDARFLFSFLLSEKGQNALFSIATGNSVPVLNMEAMKNLKVPSIDKEEMKRIGNIIEKHMADIKNAKRALNKANDGFDEELKVFNTL